MTAPVEALEEALAARMRAKDAHLGEGGEAGDSSDPPRLIGDDITPEALARLMANNGGRLAILSADGGVFDIFGGRYSDSGPNIEVLLKAHDGDNVRVDRIGRAHEKIEEPALTIGLTVQPSVIEGLAGKKQFRDRGLVGRILFSLPLSKVGRRDSDPAPLPETVEAEYADRVMKLGMDASERDEALRLDLSPEAYAVLIDLMDELEPELGPGGDFEFMADWVNKLLGRMVRVAGLLHVAENGVCEDRTTIDASTVRSAVAIARYFLQHAVAAFDLMAMDETMADADRILRWIESESVTDFSARDSFNAVRGTVKKMDRMNTALDILVDHNLIRPLPEEPTNGPGRKPSPRFQVHPSCRPQNPH